MARSAKIYRHKDGVDIRGNLSVSGTTTLTGALTYTTLTLSGKLTANGDVDLGNAVGDTITVKGTANFDEAVTLDKTLGVTGAVTLTAGLSVGTTLAVTGATTLNGAVTIGDAVGDAITVKGTLNCDEAVTLDKTLGVTGASTLTGAVSCGSTLAVTGAATLSSTLDVSGAMTVGGNLGITGTLTAAALNVAGTFTAEDFTVTDDLTVGDDASVAGDLTVTGATVCNGNVDLGNAAGDTLTITAQVDSNIEFKASGNHGITGEADQVLFVNSAGTGHLYLGTAGDANAIEIEDGSGNVEIAQQLTVAGATVLNGTVGLGNAAGDTVTITGQIAGNIEFTGASTHQIIGEADQNIQITAAGTGDVVLAVAGAAPAVTVDATAGDTSFAADVNVGVDLDVTGVTTLNGDVTLGDAAGDTITVTGQVAGSIEFTGAAQHNLIGEADQVLAVKSAGSGHLYLGTAGDENAIEIEDASGAVTVAQALTLSSTLALGGAVTTATGLGAAMTITGPTDQNLEVIAPASRQLVLKSNNATAITCDASSDVTVANDLTVSGGQLNVSGASGSQCSLKTKTATLDLSVAHSTSGGFIPEGAVVVGLVGRVLTELSGDTAFNASTWEIGTGDDTDGWGAALARAAGTEFDSADWVTETCNKLYTSADEVDFSETAGTANSGTIRIVLFYWQVDAPTS